MTKAHSGQPNCPFCFVGFKDYLSLRKHCENIHKDVKKKEVKPVSSAGKKKPCRFFNNGQGVCSPRSGVCDYDHSVIPFQEREECFHKNTCKYKPFCIFFHPEGQGEGIWEQNRSKPAQIC